MADLDDLRSRAAKVINTSWFYSMHWGKEPEKRHWTMDAKHDCIERIYYAERELAKLKQLRKELEEICPIFIPEGEQPEPKCNKPEELTTYEKCVKAAFGDGKPLMEPEEWLPCPFCGGHDFTEHSEWGVIVCITCGAEGPMGMWDDEEHEDNKHMAWNRRHDAGKE